MSGRILGDESWFDARRTGLGWKPKFYLHESPALSALIVDRGWTGRYETERPALMAAQLFRRDLRRAGITVHGGAAVGVASAQAVPLADVESARLAALVRHMDVYSDNFYAEMLLKEVGAVQGTGGSAAAGIAVERRLLGDAGVPLARCPDGRRLRPLAPRPLDAARPRDAPADDVARRRPAAVRRPRPADRRRDRHAPSTACAGRRHGLVRAKTGTTDNSSSLSGFVGDRYVFSILENGSPVRTLNAEQSQNRFAQVLARAAAASTS